MKFSTRYLLFSLLTVGCLLFAWFLNRQSDNEPALKQQTIDLVEQRIDSALARADRDARHLEAMLQAGRHDFRSLLGQTKYPAFVFENSKLLFWSENTPLLEFDNLHQLKLEQVVENKFGKYLVVKRATDPDFVILVCVPLEISYGIENRYLISGLNPAVFGDLKARLATETDGKLPEIYSENGTFLFTMQLTGAGNSRTFATRIFLLYSAAAIFFIGLLFTARQHLFRKGYYGRGITLFLSGLLLLRFLALYFNFPYSILRLGLFDPKYYAASFWSSSIGDLLLNSVLLLFAVMQLFLLYRKKACPEWFSELAGQKQIGLKLAALAGFYGLYYMLYRFYGSVYTNSLLVLDITQSLEFDTYKMLILLAILLHSAAFLLLTYLLVSVYFALPKLSFKTSTGLLLSLAVVFIAANLLDWEISALVLIALIFTGILLVRERGEGFRKWKHQHLVFGFLLIVLSALAGTLALYRHYHEQLAVHKQKFARSLTQENDLVGEYLLQEVAGKVSKDLLIRKKLMSPIADEAFIKQKIVKYYLRDYFEKYETTVKVYDGFGNRMKAPGSVSTLTDLESELRGRGVLNRGSGLFLIKPENQLGNRRYVKLIKVNLPNRHRATVVLELDLKKLNPQSVIPELLVDQKYIQPLQSKSVSYAAFRNGKLVFSNGDFNYATGFDTNLLTTGRIFTSGRTIGNHDHFGFLEPNGTVLVVTTIKYLFHDIWSNLSFLFLLHVAFFLVILVAYTVWLGNFLLYFRSNFSTKIQLFLNLGILLPLLLISVSIGSLVTNSYKKDLAESYVKRGRIIQENFTGNFRQDVRLAKKERLEKVLTNFANLSETDVNFYDATGALQASSQPLIFEAGLLPKLINPLAYKSLQEEKQQRILLSEQAGSLEFSSLYVPVYGTEPNDLAGFIGLPFFDSEKELNQKLIELITTIMNIFTVMFIGLMLFTFLAASALTVPLSLITEKLKQTTLTGTNERLNYSSPDEIGLLVQEYNQMISKLEESKNELALREKEAAWREMARQVAHEIKNPLTPMKLSLQYLQKAIAEKRDNVEELISKISQTLITNIDILSDIATSFSTFTALPELKTERINLATVLKRSIDLNFDPATARFETDLEDETVEVLADENLLMRTFNNLFLNALQAIPAVREPFIKVGLRRTSEKLVQVSIRDNGSGIPEEVQDKVFIPNFSTKYSGSGIGLAVAKKGIESAGGRIWFETSETDGTTFFLEFPLV